MPARGPYSGARYGAEELAFGILEQGVTTFLMAALNSCAAFRFSPADARDIASVWINWSVVSAPGTITARIETDASGKPSGTLVDPNAVATGVVPVAGWQQITLGATPWSSHMVQGTDYYLVILTTLAGTTQTLRGRPSGTAPLNRAPFAILTAADGSTRTNLAEITSCTPIGTLVFAGGSEECLGWCPYATADSSFLLFGNAATALKLTIPAGVRFKVAGVEFSAIRLGTPAGNLRVRILDSTDTAVAGTTLTLLANSLTGLSANRRVVALFPAAVTLGGGTYRIVLDSQASVNSSNCYRADSAVARSSATLPSGFLLSTTADGSVAHPTWADVNSKIQAAALMLDDIPAGITAPVLGSGIVGGGV